MISSSSVVEIPDLEHPALERESRPGPPKMAALRRVGSGALRLAQVGVGLLAFVGLNVAALALMPRLMHVVNYERTTVYMPTRIAQVLSAPRQDVLFMGSSRVGVGFDPALTEREVARLTGKRI